MNIGTGKSLSYDVFRGYADNHPPTYKQYFRQPLYV